MYGASAAAGEHARRERHRRLADGDALHRYAVRTLGESREESWSSTHAHGLLIGVSWVEEAIWQVTAEEDRTA